uniref:Uncharacterized protein n=1 Tax=Arundo donax TaxID=35708 RepID=A0A0A9BQJ9_ARUDO
MLGIGSGAGTRSAAPE